MVATKIGLRNMGIIPGMFFMTVNPDQDLPNHHVFIYIHSSNYHRIAYKYAFSTGNYIKDI